ncbi:hypothetical protein AVEN_173537-1 [Araneus ventricosus]|uniref:Uncharacterized protein n=1 Tax=Araneus ventricosus TaxID=182803 RepID=A0A4Y2T938_ARAVE|nr:hypothetical protein AVEN_173537-1 [Araneus ventricosus]
MRAINTCEEIERSQRCSSSLFHTIPKKECFIIPYHTQEGMLYYSILYPERNAFGEKFCMAENRKPGDSIIALSSRLRKPKPALMLRDMSLEHHLACHPMTQREKHLYP